MLSAFRAVSLLGLTALLATGPLRSADVDPYLPNDSEIVISVNVTQLLESQLGKKYLASAFEQMLKDNAQAQSGLKEIGLDPLRDFSRVTLATTAATPDNGSIVINGKFNRGKIEEVAAKFAADQKDEIKIHKSGSQTIYEMIDQNQKSTFLAFVTDSTLFMAPAKEQVSDALAKSKVGAPKKELAALIAKADAKQSMWLAALPTVTATIGNFIPPDQKAAVDNIEGILGVLKISGDAKLELSLVSKDATSAGLLQKTLNDFVNLGKLFLPSAAKDKPELLAAVDLLNTVRVATKMTTVTLSAEMTGSQIEKMVKQQLPKDK